MTTDLNALHREGPPVLCVVGPTASGKSALGVALAKAVGGEVLSADSMQVYRGMDIGTAKLTSQEMEGIPHHLIDLVNPDTPFTVAEWSIAADRVIQDLHKRGKLPIVVGGTGLYIRAITEDLDFAEQTGSTEVRDRWQAYLLEHGNEALHKALHARDAESAQRLHPNDVRRVVRALEVYELRQRPLSEGYDWTVKGGRYHTVQIGLTMEREALYTRVNERVDQMMKDGLLNEIRKLLDLGYSRELTSMQAIGYKELIPVVEDGFPLDKAVEDVKRATRRFVKRQMSWFRRDDRVHWISVDPTTGISELDRQDAFTIASSLSAGIHVQSKE